MDSWVVFKQDSERKPHQMVGSVRAADAEMALLQARSVFARRPRVISMWVAPMTSTTSWTHEDAERKDLTAYVEAPNAPTWYVFRKVGQSRSMTFVDHIGTVLAESAEHALGNAVRKFSDHKKSWVWMVVPELAISRSDPDDAASWFEPAKSKTYKQQSAYGLKRSKSKRRSRNDKQGRSDK